MQSHSNSPVEARAKADLRKQLRRQRLILEEEAWTARCAAIRDALLRLPVVEQAASVALFWPMLERREIDLRPLDTELRRRGCRVAYPSMSESWGFRWTQSIDQLVAGARGFLEPRQDCSLVERGELALVVVPALALTDAGHRLGYGAGFYDRLLLAFGGSVVSVGIAYQSEVVASLPVAEHDRPVDWIVTEVGARPIRR